MWGPNTVLRARLDVYFFLGATCIACTPGKCRVAGRVPQGPIQAQLRSARDSYTSGPADLPHLPPMASPGQHRPLRVINKIGHGLRCNTMRSRARQAACMLLAAAAAARQQPEPTCFSAANPAASGAVLRPRHALRLCVHCGGSAARGGCGGALLPQRWLRAPSPRQQTWRGSCLSG